MHEDSTILLSSPLLGQPRMHTPLNPSPPTVPTCPPASGWHRSADGLCKGQGGLGHLRLASSNAFKLFLLTSPFPFAYTEVDGTALLMDFAWGKVECNDKTLCQRSKFPHSSASSPYHRWMAAPCWWTTHRAKWNVMMMPWLHEWTRRWRE